MVALRCSAQRLAACERTSRREASVEAFEGPPQKMKENCWPALEGMLAFWDPLRVFCAPAAAGAESLGVIPLCSGGLFSSQLGRVDAMVEQLEGRKLNGKE